MRVFQLNSIGAAFQELAKFYQALATVPACSKLYQFVVKNAEYKDEIQRVIAMFSDVPAEVPISAGIPASQSSTGLASSMGSVTRTSVTGNTKSKSSLPPPMKKSY